MSYKKVYFHKMRMYKGVIVRNKTGETLKKDYKTSTELNEKMKIILEKHLFNNCIRLHNEERVDILEILKSTPKYIYARIGGKKEDHTLHLRDSETLESSPIKKTDKQDIEIYTYLLIDREHYIISYLREMSAPSIQKLSNLIDTYFQSERFYSEISSVTVEDAIPILKSKDIISTISYKLTVPTNDLIDNDTLGLSEKEFEALSNEKDADISIKLTAERNKSLFEDKTKMGAFFKKIIKKTEKIKVNAKNSDEYMQVYNLIDSIFCKNAKFDFSKENEDIQKEIYDKLLQVYESNKGEILKYTK